MSSALDDTSKDDTLSSEVSESDEMSNGDGYRRWGRWTTVRVSGMSVLRWSRAWQEVTPLYLVAILTLGRRRGLVAGLVQGGNDGQQAFWRNFSATLGNGRDTWRLNMVRSVRSGCQQVRWEE